MKLHLKKGLDLRIAGALNSLEVSRTVDPVTVAVAPDDFPGFVPKLEVKEGEAVLAGTPLMHDKNHPAVKLVSPVSGKVKAVVRGERRKIVNVIVTNDMRYESAPCDTTLPAVEQLCASGLLAMMRCRPYDIVPDPDITPRDIFITALDTAPLAAPLTASLAEGDSAAITVAVAALAEITSGKVYICHGSDWNCGDIPGAEMVEVSGPHPAGNPGIQIANIAPVNKGEKVWTADILTVARFGRLLGTGRHDFHVNVAVTGPEVASPCVVRTVEGADINALVAGNLRDTSHRLRIISGNVLTGTAVTEADGYLHYPYRQVTVILDGDDITEFMGWASISPSKWSHSPSFPLRWLHKTFSPDSRLLGGRRAMIMSGEYDRVLPMDIMAEYLLKAIISRNIDDMEGLGIYEIAPEDMALCEYVDTSKLPIQQIVRDGLDYLRKELE